MHCVLVTDSYTHAEQLFQLRKIAWAMYFGAKLLVSIDKYICLLTLYSISYCHLGQVFLNGLIPHTHGTSA